MKFSLSIAYSRGRPLHRFKTCDNVEVSMNGGDMYARLTSTYMLVLKHAIVVAMDEDSIRVEGFEPMNDSHGAVHYHQEWVLRRAK
jgi:hypothetical protein